MGLFKFEKYSAIKNAENNGEVRATQVTKNGYVFKVVNNYTIGGSKSSVDITFSIGTMADGVITFDIGGQTVYTSINSTIQNTAALVASEVKDSLDAVLLGLGYTVVVNTSVITITAPTNSSSLESITIENYNGGLTTVTITPVYTSGSDGVSYNKAALPFADDAEAKAGQVWIAMNIEDKPEILNTDDFQIKVGEYIRAVNLNHIIGEYVEISGDLCTTSFNSVSVGDILVPIPAGTNNMKWKKTTDTGYGVCFEVVEKTTFGMFTVDGAGGGYTCQIKSN